MLNNRQRKRKAKAKAEAKAKAKLKVEVKDGEVRQTARLNERIHSFGQA